LLGKQTLAHRCRAWQLTIMGVSILATKTSVWEPVLFLTIVFQRDSSGTMKGKCLPLVVAQVFSGNVSSVVLQQMMTRQWLLLTKKSKRPTPGKEILQTNKAVLTPATKTSVWEQVLSPMIAYPKDNNGTTREKCLIWDAAQDSLENASNAVLQLVMIPLLHFQTKKLMQWPPDKETQLTNKVVSTLATRTSVWEPVLSPTTEFLRDNNGMMKEKFLISVVAPDSLENASNAVLQVMTMLLLQMKKLMR